MKNLNDTTIRMQLVNQYLNAETTIEEEQMLRQYYAQTDEVLTPEENDVRLLIMSSARFAGDFTLTEEKADEFDRLMLKGNSKKSRYVAIRWVASVAAAVICAIFFFPAIHINRTEEKTETTISSPTEIVVTPARDAEDISVQKSADEKHLAAELATQEVPDAKQKTKRGQAFLSEKNVPRHECNENNMEEQNRIETPEVNNISTSELLETVRFLSEIGTDDIIITASSGNEGFVVRTKDSNGPSTSYMLKRCSDGTSIELKFQLINF